MAEIGCWLGKGLKHYLILKFLRHLTFSETFYFSDLLESGMEDFEQKLFSFLCDHNMKVSIDKFKNVSCTCRGVEIVKFSTCPGEGQVNGHNVLVQRKFYLSKSTD